MNTRYICRIAGTSLLILAGLMLFPLITALVYGESVLPFVLTALVAALCGGALFSVRQISSKIYAKEGFAAVSLIWILLSVFGALPFVISGDIPNYIDALFETVSGFTTTGATILTDVEAVSRGCLFWRSFTHWIGGLGILVFVMAVLPLSGEHSMHIMRAEVPGPVVGKLVPRARDTARILYIIYAVMTAVETVLLMLGGMDFFDALLHAFGTAGTGGFSTRNASIGAFDSAYIESVIGVFLILFGINFNLYYLLLKGKIRTALKSTELYVYLAIITVSVVAIGIGAGGSHAFRDAFFTVTSIISTAGYVTVDYSVWPKYALGIVLFLTFVGSCAGSTGGGLKVSRFILLVKDVRNDIHGMISPRRVSRVRMDGKCVPDNVVTTVSSFFFLYIVIIAAVTFIVSFDGYDFLTSFSASLTCISNVGPGLGLCGPAGNFAVFSALSKVALTLTMLMGRLEIYPVLILFGTVLRRR